MQNSFFLLLLSLKPLNSETSFPSLQDSHRFGANIKQAMVDMLNLFQLEKRAK